MINYLTFFITLLIVLNSSVFCQEFKTVNTAQDVIDNYITAIGGKEALADIESIEMKGTTGIDDEKGAIDVYLSKKFIYMNINTKQFKLIQAIDAEKHKGWMKFGDIITNLKPEEIEKKINNADESLFGNFLNPEKFNVKFELLQNETVDSADCYVIDMLKDSLAIRTSYFDVKTFMKVKELKGGFTNEFSDFKKVHGTDVIMPYMIKSKTGNVSISDIKFNSKFNKVLLKKTVGKDKKEENN